MLTKRKLLEENRKLKEDLRVTNIALKAIGKIYEEQRDEIRTLNASLDATEAEKKKWEKIAREADRMRLEAQHG